MEPRNYRSGASGTPPLPVSSPSNGYPTPGNAAEGVPATRMGSYWYYMVGESLRNIITNAGLTPNYNSVTQLLDALFTLFVPHKEDDWGVFSIAGTHTWTMPARRSSIRYRIWGAGAGGGIGDTATHGEGGSSGAYNEGVINAPEGTVFTMVVGAGANGLAGNGTAADGGDTYISWVSGLASYERRAGGGKGAILVTGGGTPGNPGLPSGGGSILVGGNRGLNGSDASFQGIGAGAPMGGASTFPDVVLASMAGSAPGGGGAAKVGVGVGKGADGLIIFYY